jgi:DNA-binding NtrC family response regulator
MERQLLIVDDKVRLCESLEQNFRQLHYGCFCATNARDAIGLFLDQDVSAVILDVKLGDESGIDVLKELMALNVKVPVIMITAFATIETAVESIKLGAFDYLQKPINFNKLARVVENAIRIKDLEEENLKLRSKLSDFSSKLVTRSRDMIALCRKAQQLALTDLPVLICGESGTGKELLADFIHASSSQSCNQIVKINCSAFAESLLDNELFGHERGAFTGAESTFQGVFERAHTSSLFLDEIGDMPLAIQSKILRTLQDQEFRRVGGRITIKVKVRFIAATNKDLHQMIEQQQFRADLLYRLNAATLTIPPLRERKEDIPLLVNHFLQEFADQQGNRVKRASPELMDLLLGSEWPGNVRELRNTLHYAAATTSGDVITLSNLPPGFIQRSPDAPPLVGIRERTERDLILNTLKLANHNKKKAAEILRLSRKTLYNKLEKYGISLR